MTEIYKHKKEGKRYARYVSKGNDYTENQWAVVFRHMNGWTIESIHETQYFAAAAMNKSKEVLPDFERKVVRVACIFTIK